MNNIRIPMAALSFSRWRSSQPASGVASRSGFALAVRRLASLVVTVALAVPALVLPAAAQAAALEQFKAFVANTRSARGDFSQRMVKEEGGKLRTSSASSGNFLFARPGKFIWTYQKPYEQLLQADGEKLLFTMNSDSAHPLVELHEVADDLARLPVPDGDNAFCRILTICAAGVAGRWLSDVACAGGQ